MNKQQGIALVQVLIITIILTMLSIFISQSVRQQVGVAQIISSGFEERLALENAQAQLTMALLTQLHYPNKNADNEVVKKWNFHASPFLINDNVEVTIQDLNGLLSINFLERNIATKLFRLLEVNESDYRIFIDSLSDWKDADSLKLLNGAEDDYYRKQSAIGPRNAYLQNIDEVGFVRNSNILTMTQWNQFFSSELIVAFNPLNAPKQILQALINDERTVSDVLALRQRNELTSFKFFELTGLDTSETLSFATGRKFRVELRTLGSMAQVSKHYTVEVKPRSPKAPIVLTDVTWNNK